MLVIWRIQLPSHSSLVGDYLLGTQLNEKTFEINILKIVSLFTQAKSIYSILIVNRDISNIPNFHILEYLRFGGSVVVGSGTWSQHLNRPLPLGYSHQVSQYLPGLGLFVVVVHGRCHHKHLWWGWWFMINWPKSWAMMLETTKLRTIRWIIKLISGKSTGIVSIALIP